MSSSPFAALSVPTFKILMQLCNGDGWMVYCFIHGREVHDRRLADNGEGTRGKISSAFSSLEKPNQFLIRLMVSWRIPCTLSALFTAIDD